jgi:flagellar protein FlaG
MAGEIVSEAILVIASVTLVGILVAGVYFSVSSISSGMSSMSTGLSQRLVTDVKVIYATNTSPTTVVFYVQNIGETEVYMPFSSVYFGKVYQLQQVGYSASSPPSWTSSVSVLSPGGTAAVTVTLPSQLQPNQYYEVMFVTQNGYQTDYVFEVV